MRVERARYLLAAIEAGSLRAAAARCGVSQPALGEQVSLLEEELDVVLLTRSRGGVRPTAAGQAMIGPLSRLVAAEDAALETAADAGGTYRGSVSIGAISVTSEIVVAPIIARLFAEHPSLRFTVLESSSTDVEVQVLGGDLDLGVISTPLTSPAHGLRRTPLMSAPLGAVVPVGHPLAERTDLTWEDLATWPLVAMRAGTVMWEYLHRHLPQPRVVVQAMTARSVKVMVSQGAGVGVLGPFVTEGEIGGLRWIRLRPSVPVEMCLVQRSDSQPSPSALVVRRLVIEQAARLLDGGVAVAQ